MTSCPVGNKTSSYRKSCIADKSYYGSLSCSFGRSVIFIKKKQQTIIQKTYQFIKVVNGVSRWHKTGNLFFSFYSVA